MLVTRRQLRLDYSCSTGVTVIQLVTAVAMLGVLSALAIPGYQTYFERARQARAVAQIAEIEIAISEFAMSTNIGQLPIDLTEIGLAGIADPWGEPIVYVNLTLGGSPRVDQDGTAVNDDYDLYSAGPDRATAISLSADASNDDIVRANSGGFIGSVSDYRRLE